MRLRRSFLGLALLSPWMLLSSALGVQTYSSSGLPPGPAPTAAIIQENPPSANSLPVPSATPQPSLFPGAPSDPFGLPPTAASVNNLVPAGVYQDSLLSRDVASSLQKWITDSNAGSQVRFVVFGGIDQEKRRSICEDSAVLHHMLTKVVPQWNRNALGVTVYSHSEPYAWYIEGKGLVMFYQVAQPVAPGDSAAEEPQDPPRELSVWQRAKLEMQANRSPRYNQAAVDYAAQVPGGGMTYYPRAVRDVPYDENYAAELDKVVTGALQQVGNFRDLAKDDSVTVFVYGPSSNPASGGRSVYAWQVNLSDIRGDEQVSAETIERRQYLESEPTSQPAIPSMGGVPSAR